MWDRPPEANERELAELAALADGSLPPERRPGLEARVAASPELQALLEEQRRALAAARGRTETAPGRLHAWLRSELARRRATRRRLSLAAAALAAGAAALALALVLPGGAGGGPTVAQAARLGARPPTAPAPRTYGEEPALLALAVDGLRYPNWGERFGWKAVGSRSDRLDGRLARTVFYERRGHRIAYTIVSGHALRRPAGARRFVRDGTELRSLSLRGRPVVTWRRSGRTCILSGAGVERHTLLTLGAWKASGAIPY